MKFTPLIGVLLIFFIGLLLYFHTTTDFNQDLGRHLKIGEIIWQEKSVPKTNLFSYTHPQEPIINHHWGSEVIFYLVHKFTGIKGLILLNTIIGLLSLGLVFAFAAKRAGILISALTLIPFLFLFANRTGIRPEIFGNLFFVLLYIAAVSPKFRTKIKFFFPVIALFWVNLHITFALGIFVMAALLLMEVIEKRKESSKKTLIANLGIFSLTFFALLINPNELAGLLYPLRVFSKYGYTIVENQSWWFLFSYGGFKIVSYLFWAAAFLVFSFLASKRKPTLSESIILATITISAFSMVRNVVLFAYAAFLTSALNFGNLRPRFDNFFQKLSLFKKELFSIMASLVVLTVCTGLLLHLNGKQGLEFGFRNQESYKKGVNFFLEQNLAGPLFNNFDIGGYLIYRLYPQERVFVDNRPEAYPVNFFQKVYIPMQQDKVLWQKFSQAYKIRTIVWSHLDITPWSQAFLRTIKENANWHLIYLDENMLIYTKNSKNKKEKFSHQALIEKLGSKKNKKALLKLASYYAIVGEKGLYEKTLQEAEFLP